ncbi:MAG: ROK family protein [Acidobacteriota bacterium]|nr:ROK family protein [Acidobacteriota bacterium]
MSKTLVVDIGGTKFSMALFVEDRIERRISQPTNAAGGRDWMLEQIGRIAGDWKSQIGFDRCGIGFGGPVDFANQRVALSTHVGGWKDFHLSAYLSDILRVPTIMDNDANAGALGEGRFGAGQGCSPLFYMTLSTGIGGGILIDGEVHRGADSWAGEIGHLNVEPNGPECLCGSNGCLERMCCGLWLARDHGKPAKELMQDPEFARDYVIRLARGLKACIMLLNPARIVIGGGIAKAGAVLFDPLRTELRKQVTGWSGARIDVSPAQLGDDSVLYGALELAKNL